MSDKEKTKHISMVLKKYKTDIGPWVKVVGTDEGLVTLSNSLPSIKFFS